MSFKQALRAGWEANWALEKWSTMNKFNFPRRNIQKERRAKRAEKRRLRSSAASLKVSAKAPSRAITGKKSRKLQKKWRQVICNAVSVEPDLCNWVGDWEPDESLHIVDRAESAGEADI